MGKKMKKKSFNKYINAIGVELEGGWKGATPLPSGRYSYAGYKLITDISVNGMNDMDWGGEINSPKLYSEGGLKDFLSKAYPQRVNSSCGMHVHVSFNKHSYYLSLMRSSFHSAMMRRLKLLLKNIEDPEDQSRLQQRVYGKQRFCGGQYSNLNTIKQYNSTGGQKYSMINYCQKKFDTIEFRGLCMFNKWETSLFAIQDLLVFISRYLQNTKPDGVGEFNYSSE